MSMPTHKGSVSEPDTRLSKLTSSSINVGTKSFDTQNREVDAAKACTPSMHSAGPYNTLSGVAAKPDIGSDGNRAPIGTQNASVGNNTPYHGKKKKGLKGKKFNGERPPPVDQPRVQNEQIAENTNGTGRKNNHRNDGNTLYNNKYRDDGGNFNKPGAPGRFNRATTFHENQMPRKYFSNNPGFRSYRGDPRRQYIEDNTGGQNLTLNGDHGPLSQHPQMLPATPMDPMGFRSPSGSWYPHHHAQVMLSHHMHHGPPPPFLHFIPPAPPGQGPIVVPQQPLGPPALPTSQTTSHPIHQAPPMPSVASHPVASIPADMKAQNTPSTSSVTTVVLASVPGSSQDMNNTNASPGEVPNTGDPRPAHIRIDSLLTTITSQLEDLKLRILPGSKRAIVPTEMARYLDTAMGMCRAVHTASIELTEENMLMKKHLDSMNDSSKQRPADELTSTKNGRASRSHSISPQRGQPNSALGNVKTDGSIPMSRGHVGQGDLDPRPVCGHGEFVLPVSRYVGSSLDRTPRERIMEEKNMLSAHAGPWWIRKAQWQRVNFTHDEGGERRNL